MLKIENLYYSIVENGIKKDIIKNVNISFLDNKIYVITGPNGSGKSTLVKLIMGINKQTSGNIIFNNKNINTYSIFQRANEGISFAFQKPITFKGIKVKDLLSLASADDNTISNCCEYLSKVGLCARDYQDRYLDNNLSGGELKRIEIATALAKKSQLYIFDEPEAGIDIWSFNKLSNLFSSLKSTIIIISHQKEILKLADEIILFSNGSVEKIGKGKSMSTFIKNLSCKKLRGENE